MSNHIKNICFKRIREEKNKQTVNANSQKSNQRKKNKQQAKKANATVNSAILSDDIDVQASYTVSPDYSVYMHSNKEDEGDKQPPPPTVVMDTMPDVTACAASS